MIGFYNHHEIRLFPRENDRHSQNPGMAEGELPPTGSRHQRCTSPTNIKICASSKAQEHASIARTEGCPRNKVYARGVPSGHRNGIHRPYVASKICHRCYAGCLLITGIRRIEQSSSKPFTRAANNGLSLRAVQQMPAGKALRLAIS